MKGRWETTLRWGLVILVAAATTFVMPFWLLAFPEFVEQSAFWSVRYLHISAAPSVILQVMDEAGFFLAILVWIVPPALMIGFVRGVRWLSRWQWALVTSLLLITGCFGWFAAQRQHERAMLWAVTIAGCVLVGEIVVWNWRLMERELAIWGLLAVSLILFVPSGYRLYAARLPVVPKLVWSVVLVKGGWEVQRPGTEFEASPPRMTMVGDRLVLMLPAGQSQYRAVSLDLKTGQVLDQREFSVPAGVDPHLYGTNEGQLLLDDATLQLLSPDLKDVGRPFQPEKGAVVDISPDGRTLGWVVKRGTLLLDVTTFRTLATLPRVELSQFSPGSVSREAIVTENTTEVRGYPGQSFVIQTDVHGTQLIFHDDCGGPPHFLAADRILEVGCGEMRILDGRGKIVLHRRDLEGAYPFAGVSRNGARMALRASDERGDPQVMIYKQFYIYDVNMLRLVATIPVTDFPERQLLTAFSGDGHLFALGDSDRLNLYEIP